MVTSSQDDIISILSAFNDEHKIWCHLIKSFGLIENVWSHLLKLFREFWPKSLHTCVGHKVSSKMIRSSLGSYATFELKLEAIPTSGAYLEHSVSAITTWNLHVANSLQNWLTDTTSEHGDTSGSAIKPLNMLTQRGLVKSWSQSWHH